MAGFDDFNTAMRMRDLVRQMVQDELERQRPRYQYATVTSIDRTNRKCTVQFPGDTATATVSMGSIQPKNTGQVVRIEGLQGDRFVSDVIGASWFEPPTTGLDFAGNGINNLGTTVLGAYDSTSQRLLYWRKLANDGSINYEALQYLTAGATSSTLDTVLRTVPAGGGSSTELGRYGLGADGVFTATKGINLGTNRPLTVWKTKLGGGELHGTNYCQRYNTATTVNAVNGAWTDVPFNSGGSTPDVQDDGTIYSAPLFRAQTAGMYLMTVTLTFGTAGTGYRSVRIITEGGTVLSREGFDQGSTPFRDVTTQALVILPAGPYGIKAQVYQNSGANIALAAHAAASPCSASFVQVL